MSLKSWFSIPADSDFSLANLPFGIISHTHAPTPRPAIAIGTQALDLQLFTSSSGFRYCSPIQPHQAVFSSSTLNAFAALGRPLHSVVRKYIQSLFIDETPYPDVLKDNEALRKECIIPLSDVTMHMPMAIGNYTDFFAGMYHAHNCGVIFRGPNNALQPNYKHLPVAYHGRASSVVVSGTPVTRPKGQILEDPTADVKKPIFTPCRRLDYELELGAFLCKPSELGEPISVYQAQDHLFGLVLLNDWSARDFQAWEAVPLGPFTAKNFCTSISPWVVLMDALEPFRVPGIYNDVENLDYLKETERKNVFSIRLEVSITPKGGETDLVTRNNGRNLLFSFPQMLAHHTAGGCNVNVGDLLGSGTISGTDGSRACGSLLEQTKGGKMTLGLDSGLERMFLEDGDTVRFTGVSGEEGAFVGFGECGGTVMPAKT